MRLTLTKQAEYALRAVVWLAQAGATAGEEGGPPVHREKAAAIAYAAGIPPLFAARVLAHLQRQGLLRARAGQQGGYTLARPATTISLLEVIEAVEGPLRSTQCVLRESRCGEDGYCLLHHAWSAAQDALRQVLGQTTLAAAAAPHAGRELVAVAPTLFHHEPAGTATSRLALPGISVPLPLSPADAARSSPSERIAVS